MSVFKDESDLDEMEWWLKLARLIDDEKFHPEAVKQIRLRMIKLAMQLTQGAAP